MSATGMYPLKPIVTIPETIPLPTVMYELPKIQGGEKTSSEGQDCRQKVDPVYNLLEHRQMTILKQLCQLKQQVEALCVAVRIGDTNAQLPSFDDINDHYKTPVIQKPIKEQLIIFADPASPPYSILALQRIWKDITVNIETHRHSVESDATTESFQECILKTENSTVQVIDLKLIWKTVKDTRLVTLKHDHPIEGEANILRYLTRLLENSKYEKSQFLEESMSIDTILDQCIRLTFKEPKFVKPIISKLAKFLDKKPWFLNSPNPTFVDAIVWSTIKQMPNKKMAHELEDWYNICDKKFLLKACLE